MVTAGVEVGRTELTAAAAEVNARRCVLIMIALTLAVNIPMFVCNTVFGDDWAWVWVYHWKGAADIQRYMWMIAHPGYGPLLNLFFWLGGDAPGRPARIIAVACHLANGWMLWRIFREGRDTSTFAASVAVLYLSSPFLGGNRGSMGHDTYDVFICGYLLSILLSSSRRVPALAASLVCLAIGLSIETLAALEVIRWWYLRQRGMTLKQIAWRGTPFMMMILALLMSRLTWLVPTGYAAGHNEIEPFTIRGFLEQIRAHLLYYVRALAPTRYVPSLFTHESGIIVTALGAFSAATGIAAWKANGGASGRRVIGLLVLGAVVLLLGMLPYVAAHRVPVWTGFYARLAVVSQFGVFILAAASLELFRGSAARGIAIGLIVFVFSGMALQFGKWMLYDELVVQDFQTALAKEFAHHEPELLFVHFRPESDDILFLKRCLANYDINVALNITHREHGSFAYDADCGAAEYTQDGKCGATAFERSECPPKWDADFVIRPEMEPFTRFRVDDLARRVLDGLPLQAGDLVIDRKSGPVRVGTKP